MSTAPFPLGNRDVDDDGSKVAFSRVHQPVSVRSQTRPGFIRFGWPRSHVALVGRSIWRRQRVMWFLG